MNISVTGRELIASFEGLRLEAYLCPAGVWTIGYGHTKGVKPGDKLSDKTEAQMLLSEDLAVWNAGVWGAIAGANTTQSQFDAMVSLAFNIGLAGFRTSSVLRQHKAGNYMAAADAFRLWNKATVDGNLVALPGLTRRRAAEAALYLADEPLSEAMPQEVEAPAGATSNKTVQTVTGAVAIPAATVALENIKPAIEHAQNTVAAVREAHSALGGLKEVFGLFSNGNFLTLILMAVILAAAVYIGFRIWRRVRNGELKA